MAKYIKHTRNLSGGIAHEIPSAILFLCPRTSAFLLTNGTSLTCCALVLVRRRRFRHPAGGQPHQAQLDRRGGRAGHRQHEDAEHVQDFRDQIQAQRALRGDHRRRQEDAGSNPTLAFSRSSRVVACMRADVRPLNPEGWSVLLCVRVRACVFRPSSAWKMENLCRSRAGTAKRRASREK